MRSLNCYRLMLGVVVLNSLMSATTHADNAAITASSNTVSLERAIAIATLNDPWLAGSVFKQEALQSQSIAAASLPDPMVSIGLANVPIDSFEFDQEPMTQMKVGVSQQFPRGDSRSLKKQQLNLLSGQHPYQRQARKAKVAVTVSRLWLDAFQAEESIRLIERDRELFEHLVNVVQSNYASASGKTRQQDLVRAQLELTRLDDRVAQLFSQKDTALSQLNEWLLLGADASASDTASAQVWSRPFQSVRITDTLPVLTLTQADVLSGDMRFWQARLSAHPVIKDLDQKIQATETGIELAKQNYGPQWGVNASYGYREDDPFGNDRADFFSVGVSFDVPLFTGNRQDKQLQSAIASTESVRTEKTLMLRKLWSGLTTAKTQLDRLDQRQQLYRDRLLGEMSEQADAALNAYTNDAGDFAEVVRAKIAELNARIDALNIDVDRLKTIAQLNYFLIVSERQQLQGGLAPLRDE